MIIISRIRTALAKPSSCAVDGCQPVKHDQRIKTRHTLALSLTVVGLMTSVSLLGLQGTKTRVAGQTSGAATSAVTDVDPWRVPRTEVGQPDIGGVWNFSTITPLERPAQFAGRSFMTAEEAAEFERRRFQAIDQPLGDGPAIDAFWLERGRLATVNDLYPTALVVDPPDGRIPPLTPEAQQRIAERSEANRRTEGPEDRSLSERCLRSASGPPMFPSADANLVRIVQTRDYVVIMPEKFHDARIVPLNGQLHLFPDIRTWMGSAHGHWDGNTLVVDTTNFTEKIGLGGRFDENLHLVERFTRVGPNTLLYEVRIDDPTTFVKPWSVALPMTKTDEQMYEFACHEGNYALLNILRAARFSGQVERSVPTDRQDR